MPVEECLKKARERFEKGFVESRRVSFICFRTNELTVEGTDSTSAMKQANNEWNKLSK